MLNSPRNIELLLHGLCTWPRIDWIWECRLLSSPKPWQFQERVTTNVSNVLQDISIVILTTCNGTQSRKKCPQLFCPQIRETLRSNSGGSLQLGDHLIAAWSRVQPRIALSSGEAELYAGMRGISETLGVFHMMRELKTHDWVGLFIVWMPVHVVPSCWDMVVEVSNTSPSNRCGFKKQFGSTQFKSRESRGMRCMLTSLPLHPAPKNYVTI